MILSLNYINAVQTFTNTHTHIHKHTHTYTYTYIYIHLHTHTYIYETLPTKALPTKTFHEKLIQNFLLKTLQEFLVL